MAFCSACGTQMGDNASFCPQCGKAAGAATGTAAAPAPAPASSGASAPAAPMAENVAGLLAYFTIIPAIVFLLIEPYNRNRYVRFHSFQCLFTCGALIVLHVVLSIIGYAMPIFFLGVWGLLGLAELALWVLLVVKAYQHELDEHGNPILFKLPIVGELAEKQAGA